MGAGVDMALEVGRRQSGTKKPTKKPTEKAGRKMATSEAEEAGSLNLIMAVSDSYSSYSTIVLQCVGLQGMKVM